MANSAARIVCLFFILLAAAVPSLGKDYTVGDSSGWTQTGDYKTWASDKSFNVGDNLVFKYGPGHTVDEVSSDDFSSCTVGNSISTDSSGSTTIPLKTAGPHYFICGVVGHYSSGMKLGVTVAAATGAGATPNFGLQVGCFLKFCGPDRCSAFTLFLYLYSVFIGVFVNLLIVYWLFLKVLQC